MWTGQLCESGVQGKDAVRNNKFGGIAAYMILRFTRFYETRRE